MRRKNPDLESFLLLGGLAVGAYFVWKMMQNNAAQQNATATASATTPSTTSDGTGSQGSTTLNGDILDPNGI